MVVSSLNNRGDARNNRADGDQKAAMGEARMASGFSLFGSDPAGGEMGEPCFRYWDGWPTPPLGATSSKTDSDQKELDG